MTLVYTTFHFKITSVHSHSGGRGGEEQNFKAVSVTLVYTAFHFKITSVHSHSGGRGGENLKLCYIVQTGLGREWK